jgi:hypothetical protein
VQGQFEIVNSGAPISWTSPPLQRGGVLQQTDMGFIPIDGQGNVLLLNELLKNGAVWQNLQNKQQQYWAYLFCSPLASVIDRQTNADLNGVIEILKDDKDYDTSRYAKAVKSRMMQPNPLQTWYEFRGEQMVHKKTYGYSLVYKMELPSSPDKSFNYLWNIDPLYAEPIPNDTFSFVENPNPIKEWRVTFNIEYSVQIIIPSEKVIVLRDGYMGQRDGLGLPVSKVAGLEWAISNILAAFEADNVLLRKKGPLGFISQDSTKDPVAGYVPLNPKEKKEIQDDLAQYGLSWQQWQYVVTRHGLRWNPMSFSVKDLDTKATIRDGVDAICDRYGYPAELMSGKNATYENRTSAERWLYNNVTIPENSRDMLQYSLYYDLNVTEYYGDLAVMQDAILAAGQGYYYRTQGLDLQYKDGVITLNEYRKGLDMDTIPDGDTYYEPPQIATAPVNTGTQTTTSTNNLKQ